MATRGSAFASIDDWCDLSGMGRAQTYDLLSKGRLRGKKVGRRTLIDVQHGLRFIRDQPDVDVRLSRAPREVRPVASANATAT
ncbi:MAG TPA: hypothetical protein VHT74_25555 [Acetobacteraceae bacterium]|jgi:hypothetical protein|nr:hypothetical protein [Acetobacteraceae bacterium]